MSPIKPLGLSANQWQFLSNPDRYVEASNLSGPRLVLETTRRQFLTARDILARLNGSYGLKERRGILLADDVGLGKTAVAALVAWVVASAGKGRRVRVLAPNDVMMRRWEEELKSHVGPLKICARALDVNQNRVKARRVARLSAGSIQVVKHSYAASDFNLACDLLIVDEAHRAKGENTAFSSALKRQKKCARRVLILTATPFSIRLEELHRMLRLIGGDVARGPVRSYSLALDDLYSGNTSRSPEDVAKRLASKATAAVDSLKASVIRHGIDDLPDEHDSFGSRADWNIVVPPATPEELEIMLRMDRALRVAKDNGSESLNDSNDSRFHVGWRHLDEVRERLKNEVLPEPANAVAENHLVSVNRLRQAVGGSHSKMKAVATVVKATIEQGEKVILFCDHHATAQELTVYLASVLPRATAPRSLSRGAWRSAWATVLKPVVKEHHAKNLLETFIEWLCADLIRAQTWSWLSAPPVSDADLARALESARARCLSNPETVAKAARRLYLSVIDSKSSRAVLKDAMERDRLELLPGANRGLRVLGVCKRSEYEKEERFFSHQKEPDTVISMFNSPFGPDVLVVTDKLSEGIDLHRYCRHLIHYELDPSPIRTMQRNGRLRRVNSWAVATRQPIRYAYPAFRGTRDHRLVQIMRKRIESFSLLLGGVKEVKEFDVEDILGSEEKWRNEVISIAKKRLAATAGSLRAIDPESAEREMANVPIDSGERV